MTQEEANQEYSKSLEELDQMFSKISILSYRLHHGAVFYNQPKEVYEEGAKIVDAISDAHSMFLEFLERLTQLQETPFQP